MENDASVVAFLDRYATALAEGDLDGVAACYDYPALVIGPGGSFAVAGPEEVRGAFAGAADNYRSRGLVGLRSDVRVQVLTSSVVLADTTWVPFDGTGTPQPGALERYLYLIRSNGELRITAVVPAGDPDDRPA